MIYTESSSQTTQIDPGCHLKNYESLGSVSNDPASTRTIMEESCTLVDANHVQISENYNDDDQSSASSSSSSSEQLQRRLNPAHPKDFETLRSELLQFRRREERKIIITARNDTQRNQMKKVLLRKEAHLLRKIGQLKNIAINKCKTKQIEHVMDLMSEPKIWEVDGGGVVYVDTPETIRAYEMKVMYDELNKKVDKVETRIQTLEKIKPLVQQHNFGLAKDVAGLLERELQMLRKGTNDLGSYLLVALRRRLLNQFTKLVTRLNSDAANSSNVGASAAAAKFQLPPSKYATKNKP